MGFFEIRRFGDINPKEDELYMGWASIKTKKGELLCLECAFGEPGEWGFEAFDKYDGKDTEIVCLYATIEAEVWDTSWVKHKCAKCHEHLFPTFYTSISGKDKDMGQCIHRVGPSKLRPEHQCTFRTKPGILYCGLHSSRHGVYYDKVEYEEPPLPRRIIRS